MWQYIEINSVNDTVNNIGGVFYNAPVKELLNDTTFFLDNNTPDLWNCLVIKSDEPIATAIINSNSTPVYPLLGGYWHGNRPTPKPR